MASATNVAHKMYYNGGVNQDWATTGYGHVGYNTSSGGINRVWVLRFTLASPASSVSIGLNRYDSTTSVSGFSYQLGPDPDSDTTLVNANGATHSGALGTFGWSKDVGTATVTIKNVPAGTNYLYVYASSQTGNQTQIHKNNTAVTYTEAPVYTLSVEVDTGASATIERTSSLFVSSGTISNGETIYNDDVITVTYSAEVGYKVDSATVNGTSISSGGTHTVSGNTTVIIATKRNGMIYIDNGSGFEAYLIYIDNGTSWDQYIPYIDNGTSWDICS